MAAMMSVRQAYDQLKVGSTIKVKNISFTDIMQAFKAVRPSVDEATLAGFITWNSGDK